MGLLTSSKTKGRGLAHNIRALYSSVNVILHCINKHSDAVVVLHPLCQLFQHSNILEQPEVQAVFQRMHVHGLQPSCLLPLFSAVIYLVTLARPTALVQTRHSSNNVLGNGPLTAAWEMHNLLLYVTDRARDVELHHPSSAAVFITASDHLMCYEEKQICLLGFDKEKPKVHLGLLIHSSFIHSLFFRSNPT